MANESRFEERPPMYARASGTCERYKIGKATLYRWVKTRAGFPRPIKAGERVTLFDLNAMDAYFAAASTRKQK